jgi:hypothetical protein
MSWFIFWQIGLCNSVSQGAGSRIIHESQRIQARNFGGIKDTPSLTLGKPSRNRDNNITDGSTFAIRTCDLLDFGEERSEKLSGSEMLLFSEILHFCSDLSLDIDQLGTDVRLLDLLYFRIRE